MIFQGDCKGLLEMFSIDTKSNGAKDFCLFVELTAAILNYPQYKVGPHDVARAMMRESGLSPLVFWSRIKRACKPLFDADVSTLRALGLVIPDGEITGYVLALSVAVAVADRDREFYISEPAIARDIARRCGKK